MLMIQALIMEQQGYSGSDPPSEPAFWDVAMLGPGQDAAVYWELP